MGTGIEVHVLGDWVNLPSSEVLAMVQPSGRPGSHSIVRATQFFEFFKRVADFSTRDNEVHLPSALIQPIAADDVAIALGRVATGLPVNGTVEVGGPEQFRIDEFIRRGLAASKDQRKVVADPQATYFGIKVTERALVPESNARLGKMRFDEWLAQAPPI